MKTDNEKAQREYFPFYLSFKQGIDNLPVQDRLEIYDAITDYAFFKKEPEHFKNQFLEAVWQFILPVLKKSWSKVENGRKGGGKLGNQNARKRAKNELKRAKNEQTLSNNDNDNEKDNDNYNERERINNAHITKPTIQEIKEYIENKSLNVDAEKFYTYNESVGWMRGKTKIINWKAALLYWAKTERNNDTASTANNIDENQVPPNDYGERF